MNENNSNRAQMLFSEALFEVERLKKFWYMNKKVLGSIMHDRQAFKSLTLTYNNLGMLYKVLGKYQKAVK